MTFSVCFLQTLPGQCGQGLPLVCGIIVAYRFTMGTTWNKKLIFAIALTVRIGIWKKNFFIFLARTPQILSWIEWYKSTPRVTLSQSTEEKASLRLIKPLYDRYFPTQRRLNSPSRKHFGTKGQSRLSRFGVRKMWTKHTTNVIRRLIRHCSKSKNMHDGR